MICGWKKSFVFYLPSSRGKIREDSSHHEDEERSLACKCRCNFYSLGPAFHHAVGPVICRPAVQGGACVQGPLQLRKVLDVQTSVKQLTGGFLEPWP